MYSNPLLKMIFPRCAKLYACYKNMENIKKEENLTYIPTTSEEILLFNL